MESVIKNNRQWKEVITPKSSIWGLNLKELNEYRDLLIIWMKRDISAIYKQTILGPIWFILQPVLTTITYVIVFSRLAKFSTVGISPVLFYLSGIMLWSYFSDCITKTSSFFKDTSAIFSKVYFPKLIIPLSIVLTNLVKFSIQFVLFLSVYVYFLIADKSFGPNLYILLLPVLILLIAGLGLGTGLIVSSVTIRYKDFAHLLTFGVQLMMFISPVFFPVSGMADSAYKKIILANPMSGIIEAFRYGFTGKGYFSWELLSYDTACVVFLLFTGIVIFNLTEKSVVDVI
jgi:lipopolysaccharide transport system permease protein